MENSSYQLSTTYATFLNFLKETGQMAELAVREALALVEKVIILLYQKFERPTDLQDDVERVQNFLEMMHACLRDSEDGINQDRQLFQQFLDVAHRFEDVLEEFMLQLLTDEALNNLSQQTDDKVANFIASWEPSRKLSSDINEIIGKNTDFVKQLASLPYDSQGGSRSRLGGSLTLPYGDLADGDEVVGFKESKEKLLKQLMDEDPKLLTIFIVGPGGSGKSTLVKNVFNSELVADFFECKAWVPVPRGSHQLDELLLDMLTQFGKKSSEEIDPKATLRLFLQQKRYVVVLDDVWSKQDLEYIVKALPNGTVGSKMIITSRNSDVVSFLSPEHIHDLSSGLSPEKAKVLFEKAFHDGQGNRQPELWECSDKILKWCGYLPFAISAVGTLLAAKVQTQVEWEDFHKNLGSKIGPASSLEIVSSILQPSFIDLPNHLKICFLYFSIFPTNYGIQRQRLIHLWVAEGFVKPRRGITIEEVAEGYLNELIARNVILAGVREIDGQVRTCCVLGLVRDFILSKEENFVTVKESNPDWRTSPPVEKIRRLSVLKADCVDLSNNLLDLNHLHTLVIFGSCDSSKIEWVLRKCKYLRVLDLQEIPNLEKFLQNVDSVILLKYLRLRGPGIRTVPETIRELRFLENLDLEDTVVKELPEGICQLYNLRRLSVSSCPTSGAGGVMFKTAGNIGALSSLQVLALVNVRNDRIIIKALGELKHVRKLGVVHLETEDGRELCSALEKMKHLSTLYVTAERPGFLRLDQCGSPPLYLQRLYLAGSLERLPMWISKLTSLQKLGLRESKLKANPLDVLEALPNLMELDLQGYYSGEEFVFRADTFKKLMKLYIEDFYKLNLMVFEDGALPVLRELTISHCSYLKSLEVEDGALPMLRELNMCSCWNLKSLPEGIGGCLKSLYKLSLRFMPVELGGVYLQKPIIFSFQGTDIH